MTNQIAREIQQYKTGNFREGTYPIDMCKWGLIHKVRALCFELLLLINGCKRGDISICLTVIHKNGIKGIRIYITIFTSYLCIALFESHSI